MKKRILSFRPGKAGDKRLNQLWIEYTDLNIDDSGSYPGEEGYTPEEEARLSPPMGTPRQDKPTLPSWPVKNPDPRPVGSTWSTLTDKIYGDDTRSPVASSIPRTPSEWRLVDSPLSNGETDITEGMDKKDIDHFIGNLAAANILLGSTPILGQRGTNATPAVEYLRSVLQATADIPLAYDGKEHPLRSQAIKAAQLKMGMMEKVWDWMNRKIGPSTYLAEKLLSDFGMSKQYWLLHTLNGQMDFAKKMITDEVWGYTGDARDSNLHFVNEGLATILNEMDQMGKTFISDVWALLSAKRQLEIERGHLMGVNLGRGEMLKQMDGTSTAAARVAIAGLQLKYGTDMEAISSYAKRIVRWQNAVVLQPQLRIGMISREQYLKALNSYEWYTPLVRAESMIRDNPHTMKIFNDGVNASFRSLEMDTLGTQHPLQEMVSKAIYINYMTTAQEIRQDLLKVIIERAKTKEELRSYGLELLVTDDGNYSELEPVVNDAIIKTQEEHFARYGKYEKGYALNKEGILCKKIVGAPMGPQLANKWINDHSSELGFNAASKTLNKNVYTVWTDGTPYYYLMYDGELMDAIDGIHPTTVNGPDGQKVRGAVFNSVRKMTSFTAALIVRSPAFFLKMMTMDLPTAFSRSELGMNPGNVISSLFEASAAFFPSLAREFPNSYKDWISREKGLASQTSLVADITGRATSLMPSVGEASKEIQDYLSHTKYRPLGGTSWTKRVANAIGHDIRVADRKRQMDMQTSIHNYGKIRANLTKGYTKTLGRPVNLVWDLLGGAVAYGDTSIRMAERKRAEQLKKKGVDIQDLYLDYLDRNITLDFARKSSSLAYLNSLFAFAAPGFQDFLQTSKNLSDPANAFRFTMRAIVAYTIPAMINYLAWHDDEEWQELDGWAKLNFFYFGKRSLADGTKAGWYRVPWGIGVASFLFKDPVVAMMEYGSQRDPLAFNDMFKNAFQQSPLAMASTPSSDVSMLEAMISTGTPTLLDPLVDVAINRDARFTGNIIDPSQEGKGAGIPGDVDREQAGIIDVMLANTPLGKVADVTPRGASYFATRTAPGLGALIYTFANKTFTQIHRENNPGSDIGTSYRPAIRNQPWVVSPAYGTKSKSTERFHNAYDTLEERMITYKNYLKKDPYQAQVLLSKYPELSNGIPSLFKDTYTYINGMKKEKKEWIDSMIRSGYDEDLVFANSVVRYDIPISMRSGVAMEYYNYVMGRYRK